MSKWKPTAAALALHKALFPPTPPRSNEIVVVVDDVIGSVTVRMSDAKLRMLRSLFAGKTDSEIFNELTDELLARFGMTMR